MGRETPRRAAGTALVGLFAFALTSPIATPAAGVAHTIDVVVVYPVPAEQHMVRIVQWQRNWGETEMGPFLAANFARVNQIYQQSGVDVEFDVVHHEQVDFSAIDPANWKATLSLALMQSELGLAAHAPYLATIEAIRDLHAGDIVIYWRDFQDGGPVSNGAGSVGGGEDEAYVQLTYGGVNPTGGRPRNRPPARRPALERCAGHRHFRHRRRCAHCSRIPHGDDLGHSPGHRPPSVHLAFLHRWRERPRQHRLQPVLRQAGDLLL